MSAVQNQLQGWLEGRVGAARKRDEQDNEAWARLMGLLAVIQDRVGQLSQERAAQTTGVHAQALLEDLEQEMTNLRSISEDIARLQWRLRRSLNERETNTTVLSRPTSSRVQQGA